MERISSFNVPSATAKAESSNGFSAEEMKDIPECRNLILQELVGQNADITTISDLYSRWLFQHYEQLMARFLLTPLAMALNPSCTQPSDPTSTTPPLEIIRQLQLYRILAVVARELRSGQVSIHGAATRVQALLFGHGTTDQIFAVEFYQCIFIFVSWLTMLYVAAADPQPGKFQLQLPRLETTRHAGSRAHRSITWHHLQCDIVESDENRAYLRIQHLLSQFGNFVPSPWRQQTRPSRGLYDDCIISTKLDYHTLSKVGHISIEWVDALSLHLEFHERSSVLRMFPFPSFCALLAQSENQTTFLSNLVVARGRPSQDDDSSVASELAECPYSVDFLLEILLSYRIIFSQNKDSRIGFQKIKPPGLPDPLLEALCSSSWIKSRFSAQLELVNLKPMYSASLDFPLMGQRILALQDYMNAQNPSDLRTLWYDRRDMLRFYTFWAVIVVGGMSILISAVQLGLTVIQVLQGIQAAKGSKERQ